MVEIFIRNPIRNVELVAACTFAENTLNCVKLGCRNVLIASIENVNEDAIPTIISIKNLFSFFHISNKPE